MSKRKIDTRPPAGRALDAHKPGFVLCDACLGWVPDATDVHLTPKKGVECYGIKYGVIDEDSFSFISPRGIDSDPCDTVAEAMREAARMLENGTEQISIVRCRYSHRAESWVEMLQGTIQIDARGVEWLDEDNGREDLHASDDEEVRP